MIGGWLNLLKPEGLSSFAALARARRILGIKKAGHAGTLDPLAFGVLPLAFGEATKLLPWFDSSRKTYRFTVRFGEQTSTDDREGEVIERSDIVPTYDQIVAILPQFIGEIEQVPPRFSALKINGKRAYALARGGENFEMRARKVRIFSLFCTPMVDNSHAAFEVECGSGTYVRSLARDIARNLGSCGHVTELGRFRVGKFTFEGGISLEKLEEIRHIPRPQGYLEPLSYVLDDIPVIQLAAKEVVRITQGQSLILSTPTVISGVVQVHDELGNLRAMAQVNEASVLTPTRIIHV